MYYVRRLWLYYHSGYLLGVVEYKASVQLVFRNCQRFACVFFFFYGMSGGMGEGGTSAGMANDARSGLWAATGGDDDESGSGGSWPAEGNSRRARARRVA